MPTQKPDPSDRPNEYVALCHHEGFWYYIGMPGSRCTTKDGVYYEREQKLKTWYCGNTTTLYLERGAAEDLAAALNHGRYIRTGGKDGIPGLG